MRMATSRPPIKDRPIRAAVVGCGRISASHFSAIARHTGRIELVAACDTDPVALDREWGLDHGAWSLLAHLFPAADVPVVQLSVDARLSPVDHVAIGRALAPLRDEGVLVLGSGNIVHNLRHAFGAWHRRETGTPDWAHGFDEEVAAALARHDGDALVRLLDTERGRLAAPTPEHYLPLLYVAGASTADDPVRFPIEGFDMSSLSMRAALIG